MSIVVVATIRPLMGHHGEVLTAYEQVVERVHSDDEGCELYALHTGDDRLVLIEKWESQAALQTHATSDHMVALRRRVAGLVEGPTEVVVLKGRAAASELGRL